MKILLATSGLNPKGGGITSYNYELLNALGPSHELYLLTQANQSEVPGFVETLSTSGNNIYNYHYCHYVIDYINSKSFDLIINSNNKQLSILAPFVNAPVVTVAHFFRGIMADEAGYNGKYLSKVIALSMSCKTYLMKRFELLENDIEVVYNFVAPANHTYNSEKENSNVLTIVYPGGASIAKSSDVVIDAVYRLMRTNLSFRFVWLGKTQTYAANLSLFGLRTINDFFKNEDGRISIRGMVSREESEKIIGSANIFLLPSRGEGCPMTLLEAMREGCIPVISDANHGSLDVIRASKTGVVVKQDSAQDLYVALKNIIENHKQYILNYRATYDYSKNMMSRDLWINKMQEIFVDAMKEEKKVLKYSRCQFLKSMIPFKFLMKKDRMARMLSIVRYRIRVEWIYLKNK